MNQAFDLEAWKAHMTTWVQILKGSSVPGGFEVRKLLDYSSVSGCPLQRRTSREGVLNRPKGTKRDRLNAAAGGEAPTATDRRKRRCVNPAIQRATSGRNPAVLTDGSPSPSTTGPSTSAVDNGLLDPDLLRSNDSTSRSSPPAASQDVTAQEDEEDENELPSLESLLGLDSTRPHSDSEDALPGLTSVSILQEPSDREFDAQAPLISDAREARGLAAFAPEDKQVLTSGSSSTSKRSGHGTDKCPGRGADVPPSSNRRRKSLSARQQRAFCEAHKRKDKLEAAKTEWALCGYPRIDWQKLGARLQTFSPALCGILNGTTPSFYLLELESAVAGRVKRKFCCMENTTAGYYGPRGQQVM
jgi:hypothetical protein